jgi:large subunit ribosomal protein L21
MDKFAVIATGGKQYLVSEGQMLKVEKLDFAVGSPVEFEALLISDVKGTDTAVGTPTVGGVKVKATVLEHGRADKVSVVKYKPKVRYRRNVGHRQPFTKIKVDQIAA